MHTPETKKYHFSSGTTDIILLGMKILVPTSFGLRIETFRIKGEGKNLVFKIIKGVSDRLISYVLLCNKQFACEIKVICAL